VGPARVPGSGDRAGPHDGLARDLSMAVAVAGKRPRRAMGPAELGGGPLGRRCSSLGVTAPVVVQESLLEELALGLARGSRTLRSRQQQSAAAAVHARTWAKAIDRARRHCRSPARRASNPPSARHRTSAELFGVVGRLRDLGAAIVSRSIDP